LAGAVNGYEKNASKRKSVATSPQSEYTTIKITPQYHWPSHEDYDFECEVVGESRYQNHLQALAGNHGTDSAAVSATAILMPEPTNQYDKNAVCININGKTVGYLSKDDAPIFLHRLTKRKLPKTAATTCEAHIMGGFAEKDGSKASYGVKLNILPLHED
jgi:hypothetical protein